MYKHTDCIVVMFHFLISLIQPSFMGGKVKFIIRRTYNACGRDYSPSGPDLILAIPKLTNHMSMRCTQYRVEDINNTLDL